jgi:acetyltransferase-like isoleucine patch superfamily enzyme
MAFRAGRRSPSVTFYQRSQRFVRRFLWRMDVAPSAIIATTAYIDRTWPSGVHIGANCRIADDAVVLTHDRTRGLYLDTRIGDNTIVGQRAVIMPGVTIGANCIVHPGAIVLRDLPSDYQVFGNPGRAFPRHESLADLLS